MKKIRNYRPARLRLQIVPFLVWLAAVAAVGFLFYHRSQRFEILGMAQGDVRQIAATCDGRLKSVPVKLFQEVHKGDVVAVLDTIPDGENIEAETATISAQIQRLQAELAVTQAELAADAADQQSDMIEAKRRFEVDVENARLQVLELKTIIETDRTLYVRLGNLNSDNKISVLQNIHDPNAQYDLHRLQQTVAENDALAEKIKENKTLLAQAEEDLAQAIQRRDEFMQRQSQLPPVDAALDVIHKSIAVQERLIEQIQARHEPVVLKSPIDGIVAQLHGRARDVAVWRPGEFVVRGQEEVVLAGDSILSIAEGRPREIIAYAAQHQLSRLRQGMPVQLVKNAEPAQIANSQVAYLGPTLERMPECFWQVPNIPQWGHPVLIPIPQGLKLVPGEMVGVRGL